MAIGDSGSKPAVRKQYYKVVTAGVRKMLEEKRAPKLENPWGYMSEATLLSS